MSSVSWMAEKSTNELIPMLKNAYAALKDKERDLMLAAEIGKSLLENNIRLKTSYEELLQQTQQSYTLPLPTPSSSLATTQLCIGDVPEHTEHDEPHDDDEDMRFIPSHRTREAMIEVLERKNVELSKRLEAAMAQKESAEKMNQRSTRKLESEIRALQSNLEIASSKIQELEDMNERQRRAASAKKKNNNKTSDSSDEEESMAVVDELLNKINSLQLENSQAIETKAQVEAKLQDTLRDLTQLKRQFEQFQFTQKDYETLQDAYERQFRHIAELNASVEEHRTVLQKLKERGVSVHSTPCPSVVDGVESARRHHTLLGELETEWMKPAAPLRPGTPQISRRFSSTASSMVDQLLVLSPPSILSADSLESVLAKATGIDKRVLDETLSFISRLEDENMDKCLDLYEYDVEMDEGMDFDIFPARDLYPDPNSDVPVSSSTALVLQRVTGAPKTFVGRVQTLVRTFFRAVWRWCRFAMILTTAVLISVWDGPSGMMIEY
ncbi:hypothetical protein BX666DRAFT_1849315 [Dichotomocladium elegans]|nr:hypothetical protein BX666DRAFT_1849315 [Dichotomocladium elegans]